MLSFRKQFLLFSGGYAVVSFLLDEFLTRVSSGGGEWLANALFFTWFVMLLVLLVKKSFAFLNRFHNRFPKSSFYLQVIGGFSWLSFALLGVPTLVVLLLASVQKIPEATAIFGLDVLNTLSVYMWGVLALLLVWATYVNFFKKR